MPVIALDVLVGDLAFKKAVLLEPYACNCSYMLIKGYPCDSGLNK